MAQTDFAYALAADSAGLPLSVSIFSDREGWRAEMQEDVAAAGFALRECGSMARALDGELRSLGDLVMLDCRELDAAGMAALSRLDSRVARSGAQMVVATSVDTLEDVFACCAQSGPQILVNPRRADRIIALGRMLGETTIGKVRELSEDDRMALLRLTEQVNQIAEKLDRFSAPAQAQPGAAPAFSFAEAPARDASEQLVRNMRPPLPDPRLVRKIIQQRQLRGRFFDADLFADPAWDMLLDLTAARVEHVRVSVTSLCIASGVPPTTALRWISQLTAAGLLERIEDETDRRRAFIQLTDKAVDGMSRYFHELGKTAVQLI